jgi:hypothetical protein
MPTLYNDGKSGVLYLLPRTSPYASVSDYMAQMLAEADAEANAIFTAIATQDKAGND